MLNIQELNDIDFKAQWLSGINMHLAVNYYVLFAQYKSSTIIVLSKEHFVDSFEYLSKYNHDYKIVQTDKSSFDLLYNKFLELKAENLMSNNNDESMMTDLDNEEMELKDFLQTNQDLLDSENAAPVIKLVNSIFYQAIKKKASDIHLEIHENSGEIRFRIDGALIKYIAIDKKIMYFVISRIKVISHLDISEKRIPQDGRTAVSIADKKLDIRISILPTYYGERVVMRILMQSDHIPTLENLGFTESLTKCFYPLLQHSHGMILVTGPTGSGKSTTLHSFLQTLATPDKNIITVEDPVEYNAENINQVQANEKVNLTFANALRSILRQDPDIVMIGEIRDKETASIAIQASLTGHLVLSTLHTNTATGVVTRLIDMNIEEFLISSSLLGVLSQRLVRKLCTNCKIIDNSTSTYKERFNIDTSNKIFKASSCDECANSGYNGRIAIGELFILDDEVKNFLKNNNDEHKIRDYMVNNKNMITIQKRLVELVENGTTSFTEALRIGLSD